MRYQTTHAIILFPNSGARVFSHQLAAGVLDYFAVLGVTSTHSMTIEIICEAHRIEARHVVGGGILRTRLSRAININRSIGNDSNLFILAAW